MIRLIRQHPLLGLAIALSVEAWIALPGEAAVAIAAAAVVGRIVSLLRVAATGLAGMMVNDLMLYALSRAGRQVAFHFAGARRTGIHLNGAVVVAAKFIPPLRSMVCVMYGAQGASWREFVAVSALSSLLWVVLYTLLGRRWRRPVVALAAGSEGRHRGWWTAAEVILTFSGLFFMFRAS